jgi:hypothetical protein
VLVDVDTSGVLNIEDTLGVVATGVTEDADPDLDSS